MANGKHWTDAGKCSLGYIFQSEEGHNVFRCGNIELTLDNYAGYLDGREPSDELHKKYEEELPNKAWEYFEKRFSDFNESEN